MHEDPGQPPPAEGGMVLFPRQAFLLLLAAWRYRDGTQSSCMFIPSFLHRPPPTPLEWHARH